MCVPVSLNKWGYIWKQRGGGRPHFRRIQPPGHQNGPFLGISFWDKRPCNLSVAAFGANIY